MKLLGTHTHRRTFNYQGINGLNKNVPYPEKKTIDKNWAAKRNWICVDQVFRTVKSNYNKVDKKFKIIKGTTWSFS